jgi:nucleoid-associated protein YgaU
MGYTSAREDLRALGAATGSTVVAAALARQLPDHLVAASGGRAPVDVLVLVGVLLVGTAAATVLSVGCWAILLAAVARTTGRRAAALERTAAALTPAVLRRVIVAGVGVGLGLAGATTASAVETDLGWVPTATIAAPEATATRPHHPHTPPGPEPEAVPEAVPEPQPDPVQEPVVEPAGTTRLTDVTTTLTSASTAPVPGAPPAAVAAGRETITVRPGDTLWDLAAAGLGGTPTEAAVQAAWPRWYEANRDVVGADPDLLRPGQVLTVPSGDHAVTDRGAAADGVDR